MIPAITATLLAVCALALLAAGDVCHPNNIENDDFSINCSANGPSDGELTISCKSGSDRWSNFPTEAIRFTAGYNLTIIGCGFPEDAQFHLLKYVNSLGLEKIRQLKFINVTSVIPPNMLNGMSAYILEFFDCDDLLSLPDQLLHDMQIGDRFWATRINITELPSDIFLNQGNITYVDLNFNRIEKLDRTTFRPLVKLKRLYLAENRLTEIEEGLFDGLVELENLDISNNMLKTLPPNIFDSMKSLRTLHLGFNKFNELPVDLLRNQRESLISFRMSGNNGTMKTMPGGFFKNHRKLEIVELLINQFTSLPGDLFIGAELLKDINIYGNKLSELPSNLFSDAPYLNVLNLSNNSLSELPNDIFKKNTNLKILYLDNNRLRNITIVLELNKLNELGISNNLLVDINFKICEEGNHNLKSIDISKNNLTKIKNFVNCLQIETIDISDNNISNINVFNLVNKLNLRTLDLAKNGLTELQLSEISRLPVSSLSTLNVSNNQISYINMTNYYELQADIKLDVDVSNNPLNCDCNIYDFLYFLKNSNITSHFRMIKNNLSCASPSQLAGNSIETVSLSELTCPLISNTSGDACNGVCSCFKNPGNKRLIVDCSNKNLKTVPAFISNPQNWSIALNMSGNELEVTPAMDKSYLVDVDSLDLSRNYISTVTLEVFSQSLRELQLHDNQIIKLETNVIEYLKTNAQLKNLTLHQNKWNCHCDANNREFLAFVQLKLASLQLDRIKCYETNKLLSTMTADELCEKHTAMIVGASLAIASIGIGIAAVSVLYYKYQKEIKIWLYSKQLCLWFVTENELDKDKKYDAFISFSHKDEEFVVNEIINKLEEGPNPYKLCVHYRDWLAGEWITEQIARSVEESRRTIVVLSPNFLDSIWGGMEFRTAHNKALKEGRARVILIIYGDIGNTDDLDPELKAYLSMNTYVKWGDPWFWDKLRYALPHRNQPPKTRNARIIENHMAQMPVHTHDGNNKAEVIAMPNINVTIQDSDKLLDPRSDENGTVKF